MIVDPESSMPSLPLSIGNEITLTISDLAFGGEGVGRFGELVVFVPFVLPGEKVQVRIEEVKKRFARGRLQEVLEPAPDRVTPKCAYFGECGGCQYQHIDYPAQLRIKQKQIQDHFERIARLDPERVLPVIPCSQPYGYRNRIMIRSQWDRTTRSLRLGFLRAENRLVVDVKECVIAEPALNQGLAELRQRPPPRGGLKTVLRRLPEDWIVPESSFFQTNFFLLEELIRVVRERWQAGGARYLIDAYCGVGFFSVRLADLVERYVGIEVDRPAIRAARQNAQQQGQANGEFLGGRTEERLPELLERFPSADTGLVLDPPRTGCSPSGLERLRQARLRQVLYISCHPATLARDLNALCAGGVYQLLVVQPLDMFPQTQHVECVADLRCS